VSNQPTAPIFNGRYQAGRELARGGMAVVYLGQDLVLHRAVALKVLGGELSRNEGFVERFRREARAAAGLSHPNVVAVYDWGEANGSYFIVMEYVAGQTLAQLLRAEGPLSAGRAAAIGAEIAAALAAAHGQGVVHRDIKPGNVLVDPTGAVKVTDFGIARAAQIGTDTPLTQTGTVLGTAAYLSPEQAEGRPADPRSDVYALGVVLYEMATGRPPFRGDTPVSIAYQHVRAQPEPPRSLNPAVPVWMEGVILRALAKDPDRRYRSAEDLRADLLRGAAAVPLQATVPVTGVAADTGLAPARRYEPGAAATPRRWNRRTALATVPVAVAAAFALGAYLATSGPSGSHAAPGHTPTPAKPPATSRPDATTTTPAKPPATSRPDATTTTTSPPPSTSLPTSFAGYAIVAGSGTGLLYCPTGVALGNSGPAGQPGNGPAGTPGPGGQGGTAGCGSNGGPGGHGGNGAPGAAGGAASNGGDGGCPPATLTQMRAGDYPCDGTGSDGGSGGNGGNAAPGENGGAGGVGGRGGDAEHAKGGNGGNGGNATASGPGGAGGPGQPGGGPTGTTGGDNGQNGANGANG
jgi:predicted Ser/Thr protein kinase